MITLLCVFLLITFTGLAGTYVLLRMQIQDQIDARLRLESDVLVSLYRSSSLTQLLDAVEQRNSDDYGRYYFINKDERVGAPEQMRRWNDTRMLHEVLARPSLSSESIRPPSTTSPNALVRVTVTDLGDGVRLMIAHEIGAENTLLNRVFWWLIAIALSTLALSIGVGVWAGREVLARVAQISAEFDRIISSDLSKRLSITARYDELDWLAEHINHALSRLQESVTSLREVSNNIAHDLRTPLNRMRSRYELALRKECNADEYRQVIGAGIADIDSLMNTFNSMLEISRAESGLNREGMSKLDMAQLAAEIVELYEPMVSDSGRSLSLTLYQRPEVYANRNLLGQCLANLIENANRYTPRTSLIRVIVAGDAQHAIVRVSDNGPGIPLADHERVLARFGRLSKRSGSGLGLSMVKAVIESHRGSIKLGANKPSGLLVELRLPTLAAASPAPKSSKTPRRLSPSSAPPHR